MCLEHNRKSQTVAAPFLFAKQQAVNDSAFEALVVLFSTFHQQPVRTETTAHREQNLCCEKYWHAFTKFTHTYWYSKWNHISPFENKSVKITDYHIFTAEMFKYLCANLRPPNLAPTSLSRVSGVQMSLSKEIFVLNQIRIKCTGLVRVQNYKWPSRLLRNCCCQLHFRVTRGIFPSETVLDVQFWKAVEFVVKPHFSRAFYGQHEQT